MNPEDWTLYTNKCRTCFNQTKGLLSLTTMAIEETSQQMSFSELLKEVANINIKDDKSSEMPQYICDCCSRKLKTSHAFIKRAQEVNEKLRSLLVHKAIFSNSGKLDCLQESEIDIPTCFEIKIECDNVEEEACENEAIAEVQYELQIKEEVLEEVSLYESEEGEIKNSALQINASEQFPCINPMGSKSRKKYMTADFSKESISTSHAYAKTGCFQIFQGKEIKKNLPNVYKDEQDADIAIPCLQCNKIFNNSKELRRHLLNTHIPEDQKCACPLCGAKFTQSCNMYKHMRAFHDPESVKILLPPKEKSFECNKCPRKYTKKKHLNYHIRMKHSEGTAMEDTKTVEETAPVNAESIAEIRPLCFVCGSSFSNEAQLKVHMRRHTGERPYKCDLCERAFPRISELTCHRRIHTGEKPYKCKICEKSFRVSTKLANHIRSHSDERPYKCTQCKGSFKYSKDLNIHNRIHTGERPYCCTVCGSTFTQSNSLKTHRMKLGHMESNT